MRLNFDISVIITIICINNSNHCIPKYTQRQIAELVSFDQLVLIIHGERT